MTKHVERVKVGEKELELSNLDKILWPDLGYTKADLIDYYERMTKYILPYLKDRPQTLQRFPNGISEAGFYQKNVDGNFPDWVEIFPLKSESEGKVVKYAVCQNKETLIYLANLACIEFHPWLSRLDRYEYPDYMVFDLDPGEDISFLEVVKAANKVHEVLEELGIGSVCKTSGKTGLHIFCPTGGKYTYEQVREFAKLISMAVHGMMAETTSLERSPSKRQNQVYLDYLQNRRGQTMASAYSLRPTQEATVSTPLGWDEVNEQLEPQKFTMKNIEKRVQKMGDLWKRVRGKGFDMAKAMKKLERYFV